MLLARLVGVVALVALCVGAGALALVALPLSDYKATEVVVPQGEPVQVVPRETDLRSPVTARLSWTEGREFVAADVAGRVTRVMMSPGRVVRCWRPFLEVDGRPILAFCGEAPPWRQIGPATVGPDADALAEMLVDLGFLESADMESGNARTRAWSDYQGDLGVGQTGIFSPSDVVWIGSKVRPSAVDVALGDRVDADSVLMSVEPILAEVTFNIHGDDGAMADGRVFSVEGSTELLSIASGTVDLPALERLALAIQAEDTTASEGLPTVVKGVTRLAEPAVVWGVPAAGVVSGMNGSTCVLAVSELESVPVAVEVVDAGVGEALVIADLEPGALVETAPPVGTSC